MLHKMNPVRMQFIKQKLVSSYLASSHQRHLWFNDVQAEMRREETDDDIEEVDTLRGLEVLDVGCGSGLLSEVRNHMLHSIYR